MKKTRSLKQKHFDYLFLGLAFLALVLVSLTILAARSNNLYREKEADSQIIDATPLIFERHRNAAPNCGSDPLITVPDCAEPSD